MLTKTSTHWTQALRIQQNVIFEGIQYYYMSRGGGNVLGPEKSIVD
jgi:hypothetical protein